jgi:hypothetical protein
MSLNLDSLRSEILEYLESQSFVIFHGYSRLADTDSFVAWDTDRFPDFHAFVNAAKNAGIRLIVFHFREFTRTHVDEATERLEDCEVTVEEKRTMERRLRELRGYEGFTCAIEISFDFENRVYLFNLRADWYEDYLDLLEDIDASIPDEDGEDDDSMGGYYSRN